MSTTNQREAAASFFLKDITNNVRDWIETGASAYPVDIDITMLADLLAVRDEATAWNHRSDNARHIEAIRVLRGGLETRGRVDPYGPRASTSGGGPSRRRRRERGGIMNRPTQEQLVAARGFISVAFGLGVDFADLAQLLADREAELTAERDEAKASGGFNVYIQLLQRFSALTIENERHLEAIRALREAGHDVLSALTTNNAEERVSLRAAIAQTRERPRSERRSDDGKVCRDCVYQGEPCVGCRLDEHERRDAKDES